MRPWCFIHGGECHRPPILRTVQEYFWCPSQGQTRYVWTGQTAESGLRWCWAQYLIGMWVGRASTSSPHHCRDARLHSYVGVWYWTDQTRQICRVKGWLLETGCPLCIKSWSESYFIWKAKVKVIKSWSYEQLKNWKTNQVNPCAHVVENLVSKQDPKFSSLKIWFSSMVQRLSHFREIQENLLQRLSHFFTGFPISSTAFWFLQRLSDFFNGFPISEKPSSMAFRFLLYCQNTHILNILIFCSELCNSCVKIFRHWVFCQVLIAVHHTVLQVFKTCMLKWAFN